MKLDLNRLAIKVFQFCAQAQYSFGAAMESRSENEKADYISRLIELDDWQIIPELFRLLEDLWGPHIVDCFANFYTPKLPRCSRVSGTRVLQVLTLLRKVRELLSSPSGSSRCSCCPLSILADGESYHRDAVVAF